MHLYDIQTFTILKCSTFQDSLVPIGTRVRGISSGAVGYAAKVGGATGFDEIALSQTTGTFMEGEQIILNENPTYGTGKLSIKEVVAYTIDDIKSVFVITYILDFIAWSVVQPGQFSHDLSFEKIQEKSGVETSLMPRGI